MKRTLITIASVILVVFVISLILLGVGNG